MLNETRLLSASLALCMAVGIILCLEHWTNRDNAQNFLSINRPQASPSSHRKLATMMGKRARLQQLAAQPAQEQDDDQYITFENDFKIDYENLGEGSIVDQRYPRRLPGQSQLLAEMREVFDLDGNWSWFDDLFNGGWLEDHSESGVFVRDPSHDKLRRLGVKTG